jgi:hypothetical protein
MIKLYGKRTVHTAAEFQQECIQQLEDPGSSQIEVNWAGSLGLDTSVLQLLLALSREKQLCGTGDPGEAVREALALAGVDSSLRPISNPE